MHHFIVIVSAVGLLFTSTLPAAERAGGTDTFCLRYVPVLKALEKLKAENLGDLVTATDSDANTIMLNAGDERLPAARLLLVTLDQRPQQVLCSVIISEVNASTGEERVMSGPTILTLAGKEAVVTYPLAQGKSLKFQVTPRVLK